MHQEQKRLANLDSDQKRLENLATVRNDLQRALREIRRDEIDENVTTEHGESTDKSTESRVWMSSRHSSFFLLKGHEAGMMLQSKLDETESELVELCEAIQKSLSGSGKDVSSKR